MSEMRTRKTNNWKKEYSISHLRRKGARDFKIFSADKLKYFGWHLSTILTDDIHGSLLKTNYDLTKIKVVNEQGNEVDLTELIKTNKMERKIVDGNVGDVDDNFFDKDGWSALGEDDGDGSYCCGKRMVLASSGIVYQCLKCGGWEHSSR
jgi:hypothetical protein